MEAATNFNLKVVEQLGQLAQVFRQQSLSTVQATDEVAVEPPQRNTSDGQASTSPPYRVAPNRQGDFVKLTKAAFDDGLFCKADGTPATNVEDLARYIGRVFGIEFTNWRQTLRGAVLPDSSLDFFERLMRWARRYKDKIM